MKFCWLDGARRIYHNRAPGCSAKYVRDVFCKPEREDDRVYKNKGHLNTTWWRPKGWRLKRCSDGPIYKGPRGRVIKDLTRLIRVLRRAVIRICVGRRLQHSRGLLVPGATPQPQPTQRGGARSTSPFRGVWPGSVPFVHRLWIISVSGRTSGSRLGGPLASTQPIDKLC